MSRRNTFPTIDVVGGLFPGGLLERVDRPDSGLEAASATDYHLASGERIRDAITRSWNRLLPLWQRFAPNLDTPEKGAQTGATRQEWLLPLFDELGYSHLQAAPAFEIDAKRYPISHLHDSVPIHLVGVGVEIDRRAAGIVGAASASPHGLMQEFLNRTDDHLWGIVSNGRRLRLLRDNASLTRTAYAEFDLAEMFGGEVFSDFAVLWLTCHASRLEGPPGKQVLERWREDGAKLGVRALDALRDGVERAIETLGSAAIAHPANHELRRRLDDRTLDPQELYRQLLRVVYRMLFLLVAESRGLLTDPAAPAAARDRYHRYYSISRIRDLAESARGGRHGDLWRQLNVVSAALESKGEPALALPPLGGFLWSSESTAALNDLTIPNEAVLDTVRSLTVVKPDKQLPQRVDYANLGAEELGSIYESLLEYVPQINPVEKTFTLAGAAGNERKTTGSYYTPTSLIEELLNSALDPVLDEAAAKPDPEEAVLALKVVDPAAGSGHFLIAAAHRIANRLARIRAGEDEPSPDQLRTALRDVIGHCIYAVDINPMAVELAKVALWIEAMEPGKPLTFLDHHIVVGNSLLGVTPKLLDEGIPDEAYKALTGDDKEVVKALKTRNKDERKKHLFQLNFGESPDDLVQRAADELAAIDSLDDTTVAGITAKAERFERLVSSPEQQRLTLAADAWVAAFVGSKTKDSPAITNAVVNAALHNPDAIPAELAGQISDIALDYKFHHWHLVFPDVFAGAREDDRTGRRGGFDVVLGNPPWERVKLQEKEFFATVAPEIATAPNKAARERLIKKLVNEQPELWDAFQEAVHEAEAVSHFLRTSGVYPLCGRGDVNTYTVFAEDMRSIVGPTGRAGVIVPTGIATDDTTKHFFADLVEQKSLVSLFDFENRLKIFPGIDSRIKFCLLTLTGPDRPVDEAEFCFFALETADLQDTERRFTLTAEDFALLNPNTRTCPIFRTRRDAEITKGIYRRVPVLIDENSEDGNPWGITFMAMFHSANDAHRFVSSDELEERGSIRVGSLYARESMRWLPLYEAKMVGHLEPRSADIVISANALLRPGQPSAIPTRELADPLRIPMPRYWVAERDVDDALSRVWLHEWLLGWRDVTSPTNERTVLATAIPRSAVIDSFLLMLPSTDPQLHPFLLAAVASFAFDFVARQKVGGVHVKYYVMKQLPVPRPELALRDCPWDSDLRLDQFASTRVAELLGDSISMMPFATSIAGVAEPFTRDGHRRELIRAELDAACFHLYALQRSDVEYIMETFPIVKRKDITEHGSYRTKELILDVYDRMAKAIETGEPYQTILDPPPADPSLCHEEGCQG